MSASIIFSSIFLLTLSNGEIIQINDSDFSSLEECISSVQKEAENFQFYMLEDGTEKEISITIDGACVKHKKGRKIKLPKAINDKIKKIYQAENFVPVDTLPKID